MKLTNTRRAVFGAVAILILGLVLAWRNAGQQLTQRDYLLIGGAVILIVMNLIGSYYFDWQNHRQGSLRKPDA